MSFDYNEWESELRSKVETHEFAFDASAWEEMDKLLNQGGAMMAPKESIPTPSAGRFTSWILSGIIVTAVGLFGWWMLNSNDEHTHTLSSFSLTVAPDEKPSVNNLTITPNDVPSKNQVSFKNAPMVAEAGNASSPKNKQVFPADAPTKTSESLTEEVNLIDNTTSETSISEPDFLADRSAAYLTPLLQHTTAISLLPTALDEPVSETQPIILKRKRNRRTLYPDIIERY